MKQHKIIILFGSNSQERLVSVASAQALCEALGSAILWFWHKDGPIYNVDKLDLLAHQHPFVNEYNPSKPASYNNIAEAISSKEAQGHIFVLATHGGAGENGELQALLEENRLAFTGSDAKSSKIAFNKIATKEHLEATGIKMSPHILLNTAKDDLTTCLSGFIEQHKKILIKPVCGGSSLGCLFAQRNDSLLDIIEKLHKNPGEYIVEKHIKGREFTVGVIERKDGLRALPVTEIEVDQDRDFDYEGKYLGLGTKEITPALIDESLSREAQMMALKAHSGLGLEGYSRTDMILSEDGFYFLETNTLPGLSRQSLIPEQLSSAHISLREFMREQISLAEKRSYNKAPWVG